jgi:transcriptional regulator with PAS, ATPase and Fis domain
MLLDKIETRNPGFAEVLNLVRRVAPTDASILITGETGAGKDFIAELIHEGSARRAHPFLKIDCASIPVSLAESEFFGYEKGAFSDATEPKQGKLQMAQRGTIYLDGINHLTQAVQSKLLRFVQERCFEPLGGSRTVRVDCRLIASCNFPLETSLKEKQLREDLYYRLAAVVIELPSLRQRMEDLEILSAEFLRHFNEKYNKKARLSSEAASLLQNYSWPGNLRELRNVLENAIIHSDGMIQPSALALHRSITQPASLQFAAEKQCTMEDVERMYISEVLRRVRGHQGKAAKILGINRKTLLLKKRKYGLD